MNLKKEDVQREMDRFLQEKQMEFNQPQLHSDSGFTYENADSSSALEQSSDKKIANEKKFDLPA